MRIFFLADNLTIEVVGSIDIQDKNNLTFDFSDGIDITYLWPRKHYQLL